MLSRRRVLQGLGAASVGVALPVPLQAAMTGLQGPLPKSTRMSAGKLIPAPSPWLALLRQHPELDPAEEPFAPAKLSVSRATQIVKVNKQVNETIAYRDDDRKDVWEVAERAGDCEDFAILKLRSLIRQHGFPRGALTLAACRAPGGRGHAVLLVHSDRGVYVMDNLTRRVLPWKDLPYNWIAREEPGAPFRLWRSLQV